MGRKPLASTWERTLYRKNILKSDRHSLVGEKNCLCNNGEQFKIARGQLTALLPRQSHVCQCLPCTPPVLLVKGCCFLIDTGQWKKRLLQPCNSHIYDVVSVGDAFSHGINWHCCQWQEGESVSQSTDHFKFLQMRGNRSRQPNLPIQFLWVQCIQQP